MFFKIAGSNGERKNIKSEGPQLIGHKEGADSAHQTQPPPFLFPRIDLYKIHGVNPGQGIEVKQIDIIKAEGQQGFNGKDRPQLLGGANGTEF